MKVVVALAVAMFSTGAWAGDSPATLYADGRFADAEAVGVAQNDADGYSIAARAALTDEMIRDEPCLECLKHAEELARRAIAADPKRVEGHIYLAIALGYEARIVGDLAAQSKGYADEAKKHLDVALSCDPNDPWTLAALGSWHIEIARGAGSALARWLFDASFASGRDYYAKAFALAPDNPVLRYQYALAVAAYDLGAYRKEAEDALLRAVAEQPSSAYERFVHDRARELLDTLSRGDTADVERLLRRDRGYPV